MSGPPRGHLVEFVVTAHNAERTIGNCVQSLLTLSSAGRITVVVDASSDRTAATLTQFQDPRLRVVTVGLRSRAKASNLGFSECSADYVCSVDSDVRFLEDRFARVLPLMHNYPFLMLTHDPSNVGVRPVELGSNFDSPRNSFVFCRRQLPGLAFAEVYPKTGGEDTDLAIRLLKAGVAVGAVYGGYVHDRAPGPMGFRRRLHFHVWNLVTYLRHSDVPMCRQRLAAIARHPVRRIVASLREELGDPHNSSVR